MLFVTIFMLKRLWKLKLIAQVIRKLNFTSMILPYKIRMKGSTASEDSMGKLKQVRVEKVVEIKSWLRLYDSIFTEMYPSLDTRTRYTIYFMPFPCMLRKVFKSDVSVNTFDSIAIS